MKQPLLIGGFVLLAGIAWLGYSLVGSNKTAAPQMSQSTQADVPENSPAAGSEQAGKYQEYAEAAIASTPGTKILFFHAPWCPQCRDLEADIKNQQLPSDLTIFKVDYDTNQALRQKYGVTLQTTLVKVDDSGNLVEKYVAYSDPTFASVEENLLR